MKKNILIGAVLSIAVLTFGLVGFAYAQDQTPEYPHGPGSMSDYGQGHGHGGHGHGGMHAQSGAEGMGGQGDYGMMGEFGEEGPMHENMVAALAETLGLSAEEIETRHDAGETLWDIAKAEGLNAEEIQDFMSNAHDGALDDAVANGWMTQEQADWMNGHMNQMWDGETGFGGGHCGGNGSNSTGAHRGGMN